MGEYMGSFWIFGTEKIRTRMRTLVLFGCILVVVLVAATAANQNLHKKAQKGSTKAGKEAHKHAEKMASHSYKKVNITKGMEGNMGKPDQHGKHGIKMRKGKVENPQKNNKKDKDGKRKMGKEERKGGEYHKKEEKGKKHKEEGKKEGVTPARKQIPKPFQGEDYTDVNPPGHNCEWEELVTPCYRMNNPTGCEKQIIRTCNMKNGKTFDGCCCAGKAIEYVPCDKSLPECQRDSRPLHGYVIDTESKFFPVRG